MAGYFISRKHWPLASVLLLFGSLAGYGLGQQVGHVRQQPRSHMVAQQAANVAGDVGSQSVTVVTTVQTAPTHHTSKGPVDPQARPPIASKQPHHKAAPPPAPPPPASPPPHPTAVIIQASGPVQISVSPQPSTAAGAGKGHKHGKDDGHPKASHRRDSEEQRSNARGGQPDGQPGKGASHTPPGKQGKQRHAKR